MSAYSPAAAESSILPTVTTESHNKIAGHPAHPIMVTLPLGLFSTAVLFDIVALTTNRRQFALAANLNIATGIVTGLAAAVPGFRDWRTLPQDTRAKRIGRLHGLGNMAVTGLFAASWYLRRNEPDRPTPTTLALELLAFGIAGVTGWLGGELVDRLGVGVDNGAHLNATNALTHQP